ncbi:ferredoxin--NADP reductase [Pelagibaculum spongiae]|uniref:FAD-binding FR-type domain-containing protein n=1 Tax=Pelagibaculum spongiae TaxID=2080658 RepID=A0A2V1GSD6_9GAMM|nr:FAD-binding oxidoreductase [Pelagibaculum spongiae]PVZ67633.1 hypothetical protein DC094_14435 [Pelagibaculum spongiae]
MFECDLKLVRKHNLAPRIISLTYEAADNAIVAFQPGQFLSLQFPANAISETPLKRSYSIVNISPHPQHNRQIEIAVTLIDGGVASEYFKNTQAGDLIAAKGPMGNLVLPEKIDKRLILIGTGTGMAPYRSMLHQLKTMLTAGLKVEILQGARTRDELIYQQEFLSLATEYHAGYRACLSRQADAEITCHEYAGHVGKPLQQLEPDPENDLVYLCGHPAMVDQQVSYLTELGFDTRSVKREKYFVSGKNKAK